MTTLEEKLREALEKKFGEKAKPWLDEHVIILGPEPKEEAKDD
jgi:hypothetical protein